MEFRINNKIIKNFLKPYVIAEACINHEGDIDHAKLMIKKAKESGADCIKFQIHNLENEMLKQAPKSDNFKDSLWDTLEKTNFNIAEQKILMEECKRLKIDYLCTPFSKIGSDELESIGVSFYKIGSGEMTNLPLVEHIAKKNKPMIISTGMSALDEIKETVDMLKKMRASFALTHCTSVYPCPYQLVNIRAIPMMNEMFNVPVGLSDHTSTIFTSLGAIAHGACIIEKHFTLNKKAIGPDHASSIEPDELTQLVYGVNAIYLANGNEKRIFDEEKQVLSWARESVVTEIDIKKGQIFNKDNIWVKRPSPGSKGIPAKEYHSILGKKAAKNLKKNKQLKMEDISD